jgi:hypothetical protein
MLKEALAKFDVEIRKLASYFEKMWGPYVNNRGRKIVRVRTKDGKVRTMAYARYLMIEHLGRELDPETETVDHKDRDKFNDSIDNYRLVPRAEHSAEDTRRVRMVECVCDMCGKKFERSPRMFRSRSKEGRKGVFCSKSCAGRYGRQLALKRTDEMPAQTHMDSEYYYRKFED